MKVLYIIHQFFPHFCAGTERITYNIASMVQKAGNKVKVITYRVDQSGPITGEFNNIKYNEFVYRKVPVIEFSLKSEPANFHINLFNNDVFEYAKKVLRDERPDIVHICHPMRSGSFLQAAQELDIPCVVTITDLMYICPKVTMITMQGDICCSARGGKECNITCPDTGRENEKRMEMAKNLLLKADAITTPSNFTKNMIRKQIPELNIDVIKHGLEYPNNAIKSKLYEKNSKIVFGFVGSIQEHKGLHILVKAFEEANCPNTQLNIYGGYVGAYGERLVEYVEGNSRIHYFGRFDPIETDSVYNEIDVLVIPSLWYETYVLVKYEAFIREIPVIAADIGALGDGIEHGYNSYKFSISEIDSLRNIIIDIANNPEQLNEVKKNLGSFYVPTIEQESFQYLTLYKRTIVNNIRRDLQKNG